MNCEEIFLVYEGINRSKFRFGLRISYVHLLHMHPLCDVLPGRSSICEVERMDDSLYNPNRRRPLAQ